MTQSTDSHNSGNEAVGKAVIVYGQPKAQSPDGTVRVLNVNSPIFANDTIVTGASGSISIIFNTPDQLQLDLGRMSEVVIDEDIYQADGELTIQDAVAEVELIQEALLEGEFDPTTDLEAPAAGPGTAVANAGGGISNVKFDLTAEEVTPESGAETTGITFDFPDPDASILVPTTESVSSIEPVPTSDVTKADPITLSEPTPVTPSESDSGTSSEDETTGLSGSISRVVEEEELVDESTAAGTIEIVGETSSSVDHWKFTHNGGPLTIDLLSELGFPSWNDLDDNGLQANLDTFIRLYVDDGDLTADDLYASNDDSNPADSGDGSTHSFDSLLTFSNLPAGNYILAVGDFFLTDAEALSGVNQDDSNVEHGPYQIQLTGSSVITATPDNGTVTRILGGNPDDNDLNPEDADQPDSTVVTGNILDSDIDFGDSTPASFGLTPVADLPALLSRGEEVTYAIAGDTLQATAGDRPVFTFEMDADGNYTFTLIDTLDNVEPEPGTADENADLQLASPADDGSTSVSQIDLSTAVRVTDTEGNQESFPEGTFLFTVEDDIPIAVDDAGTAFGYSSYEGSGDAPPSVVFDVLANDLQGADGAVVSGAAVEGGSAVGTVAIVDGKLEFTPGEEFSEKTSITYTITDGDGDTVSAELVVTEQLLIVGSNASDQADSEDEYVVGEGSGAITGGAASDILIGDYNSSPVNNADLNLLLILDTSGSMGTTRISQMEDAIQTLFGDLIESDADNVRVHLVEYNRDADVVGEGTYDLRTDGEALSEAEQQQLFADIETLSPGGATNYEAGMQFGESWVNEETTSPPLNDATNTVLFLTDGSPNHFINANGDVGNWVSADYAMDQILGSDGTNEVATLQDWGTVRAIGIDIDPADTDSIERLKTIDSNDDPQVTEGEDLVITMNDVYFQTVSEDIGNDQIQGSGGDDLIFGDALYTDNVINYLLENSDILPDGYDSGLEPGAGWAVFEALEDDDGIEWTRTDTINYILEHQEELGQSNSSSSENQQSGSDTVEGGEGDDLIFGQEGDDALLGGEGEDTILGGTGDDTLYGDQGDDPLLDGGEGEDQLIGGDGEDTLIGGEGNDILVGDDVDFSDPDDPVIVEDSAVDNIDLGGGSGDDIADNTGGEDNVDPGAADMTEDDIDTLIAPPDPIV